MVDYAWWYNSIKRIDDRFVEKTHEDFDERDKIMISKNAKAKNRLGNLGHDMKTQHKTYTKLESLGFP